MNIIIIGAGSVGFITAEYFVREGHNVTIIDTNLLRLQKTQDLLDVSILEGQGTDINALREANIENTDLFLALTENDEANIVACKLAKHIGVPRKIARLNQPFHLEEENTQVFKEIGVDEIIDTEKSLIEEIVKDLTYPGITDLKSFFHDSYSVGIFSFGKNSPHKGKTLKELSDEIPVIPLGYTKLDEFKTYDENVEINEFTYVYYGFEKKDLDQIYKKVYPQKTKLKNVMIYGDGYKSHDSSIRLAQALRKKKVKNIELITDDEKNAIYLSRKSRFPIILEDPSKPLFAKSDSLRKKDAFIAISKNFEKNLFSCLVAYQKKVPYTICLARYPEHVNFISTIPLTSFINPALVTANKIMKYHKIDTIASRTILNFEQVECIEFKVNNETPVKNKKVQDLPLKHSRVIAIKRNGKLIYSTPETPIKVNDHILLLVLEAEKNLLEEIL